MKTIWKFQLSNSRIEIPKGAVILNFQTQQGIPCIWILVDPKADTERRTFEVYATGNTVHDSSEYIGTYQERDGLLIWHIFEVFD